MVKSKFQHIENRSLVSTYGRVLRKSNSGTIVDFDDTLPVDFDFQLNRIEHLVKEFNGYMPPNRMSHYILALIVQGSGQKSIGHHTFFIEPNMGMIFPKKIIHSTHGWDLNTKGYMLSFNENFFTSLNFPTSFLSLHSLFRLSMVPYRLIPKDLSLKLTAIFEEFFTFNRANLKSALQAELFMLKVVELLFVYKVVFEQQNQMSDTKYRLFDAFVERVEADFRKEKSVAYYANVLATHPNHLNSIVNKHAGCSAKRFIQDRIVLEAKYLLRSTPLSVKEIAYDLGFADCNYFYRLFKNMLQSTPQLYRTADI